MKCDETEHHLSDWERLKSWACLSERSLTKCWLSIMCTWAQGDGALFSSGGEGGVSTRWSRNIFKYWVSCNTFRCCRDTLPLLPPIENHKKMGHTWEFMCQPRLWGYVWQERRQFFRAWCYLFLVRNKHRKAIVSMWIQLSALIPSDWISYPDVRHLPLIPYMLWRLFLEKVLQEWLWTGTR